MMTNHEVFENVIASAVDVASVMIAYTIGIRQSSVLLGLAYGIVDAIIVVWMRKPLAGMVASVINLRANKVPKNALDFDV
jgi:hypothetical protein